MSSEFHTLDDIESNFTKATQEIQQGLSLDDALRIVCEHQKNDAHHGLKAVI